MAEGCSPYRIYYTVAGKDIGAPFSFITALNTGMRRGEIFALTWEQVDLKNRVITVEHTKTGSARKIPMNQRKKFLLYF